LPGLPVPRSPKFSEDVLHSLCQLVMGGVGRVFRAFQADAGALAREGGAQIG